MPLLLWHATRLKLFAIVLLLAAFALRLINLTFQPLWFDEGWSVWFATSDLPAMIEHTAVDIHPPFYYALLHMWIGLTGTSEFALRMLSVLVGVLTVALLSRLARALLGWRAAGLAGILMAVAPLQIYYAQEVRMYGLVTLLGFASTLLFWAGMNDQGNALRRLPLWVAYVVVTCAAMYTEYYGAFIPLFHGIYWLGRVVVQSRSARMVSSSSQAAPKTDPPTSHVSRNALVFPLASFIALLISFVPWVLYAGPKLQDYVANKVDIEQYVSLNPLDYVTRHLVAFSVGHLAPEVGWLGWAAVALVGLAGWGAVSNTRGRAAGEDGRTNHGGTLISRTSPAVNFLLLYLIVPILAGYLVQLRFPFAPPRMERLLLLASPAFVMLVAQGITGFAAVSAQPAAIGNRLLTAVPLRLGAVVTALVAVFAVSLASFYTVPRYPEQDYRVLAARIDALALPGDVVVLVHPWQVGFLRAYLNTPVALQQVTDPAWGAADQAQLDGALGAGRRVWLPAYQTLGRILETAMENYLARQALRVDTTWYQTTLLSFYAPLPKLETQSVDNVRFADAAHQLTLKVKAAGQVAQQAGWGIVPLQLTWLSTPRWAAPFPHISIRLQDAQQRYWSVQDAELAFDRLPESRPGACLVESACTYTYTQNIGFLIPAGTPPGDYRVTLALYDGGTQQPIGSETAIDSVKVIAPQSPPPIAALPIQTALHADWADASLLGYTLRAGTWRAGEPLHLDLFFQAREPSRDGGRVFVQLEDTQANAIAGSEGKAAYPIELWNSGDLIHDQRDLTLPAGLAAGRYRLVTGLLHGDGKTRVPLARGGDEVLLREITLESRPHQFTPPNPQVHQDIRFGAVANVVGYDLMQDTAAKTLRLRLYWNAVSETETAFKVFVHIISRVGQTPVAQHDSQPANGNLPTTAWVKGEYLMDDHLISLADVPPGDYGVLVGLYDPATGVRVQAFASNGKEFPNDAAELARVTIGK
jgi:hypothetical protein